MTDLGTHTRSLRERDRGPEGGQLEVGRGMLRFVRVGQVGPEPDDLHADVGLDGGQVDGRRRALDTHPAILPRAGPTPRNPATASGSASATSSAVTGPPPDASRAARPCTNAACTGAMAPRPAASRVPVMP